MGRVVNYYKMMKTGLYRVIVDRMALYDKSNSKSYVYSTYITNDGELATINPEEPEIVESAISILGMIEIHKKGYPIGIVNISNIKEIVEIIYNHISACIEVKNDSIYQEFTVDVDDLIDMEEFMLSIIEANPETIKEHFKDDLIRDMKSAGLISMFDSPMVVEEKENDVDAFRRITRSNSMDLSISDLINTI